MSEPVGLIDGPHDDMVFRYNRVVGLGDTFPRYPFRIEVNGQRFNFTKSYEELVAMGILIEEKK